MSRKPAEEKFLRLFKELQARKPEQKEWIFNLTDNGMVLMEEVQQVGAEPNDQALVLVPTISSTEAFTLLVYEVKGYWGEVYTQRRTRWLGLLPDRVTHYLRVGALAT